MCQAKVGFLLGFPSVPLRNRCLWSLKAEKWQKCVFISTFFLPTSETASVLHLCAVICEVHVSNLSLYFKYGYMAVIISAIQS